MKEITLKIPDKKVEFFMELIKELGFEVQEEIEIPEEHKNIVRERIRKSEEYPDRLLKWDDVKDSFDFDR